MQIWSVEHEPVNLNSRLQNGGTALTIHPPKESEATRVFEGGNKKVVGKVQRRHNMLVLSLRVSEDERHLFINQ